jgi:hypothetical protein
LNALGLQLGLNILLASDEPRPAAGLQPATGLLRSYLRLGARGMHQVLYSYALESRCKTLLSLRQRRHDNGPEQSAWLLGLNSLGRLKYIVNTDGSRSFGELVPASRTTHSYKNAFARECLQNRVQIAPPLLKPFCEIVRRDWLIA